jgi:two-component system cell cycle sensor histidine kinase/response regulator CckA
MSIETVPYPEPTSPRGAKQTRPDAALANLEFLAGGVAHDFNNLLMGVLGHAELAAMATGDPAAQRHHLTEIVTAARRATVLTEQLLAFSGHGRLHMEPLDLTPELERLIRNLVAEIPGTVRLGTALEQGLPPVRVDRRQIALALRSAVQNALEAMDGREGTLRVSSRLETLGASECLRLGLRHTIPDGDYVVLEVSDDGPGVAEAIRDTAFEPFVSSHGPGRGLGLAAVDGILRSHHGSAGLINHADGGARLSMVLPVDTGHLLPGSAPAGASPPAGDEAPNTVLLVDDDDTVREATAAMLEILGLSVIGASNGRQALQILQRTRARIVLVLSDAMMPELTGVEMLESIRSSGDEVPVLLSSGFAADDVLLGIERLSPDGFIKKPYRFADLKEAVLPLVNR